MPAYLGGERVALGDVLFLEPLLLLEYHGTHHQEDRGQYTSDIPRFEVIRRHDIPYLEVTKERIRRPRRLVRDIHAELVRLGYDGPEPVFGSHWKSLMSSLARVSGPKVTYGRVA